MPLELSRARYIARAECGQRHPGHHDSAAETLADFDTSQAERRHEPLDLGIPFLTVDTTDGYIPDIPASFAFIAAARPDPPGYAT